LTLYEKRGRRYYPVSDTEAFSGIGKGSWLVTVERGRTSARLLLSPDHAGFVAASQVAIDAMMDAMRQESAWKPRRDAVSPTQKRAYAAYREIMGDEIMCLERSSAWDIAQAGIDAVQREMEREHGKGKAAAGVRSAEADRKPVQKTRRASVA
jgi:hypothetical protein